MHALLNHPAFQAGLAPFLVALLTAELFQRMRLSGLAIVAGFAVTVYLMNGFGVEPLTSTRKIVWLGVFSAALGIPLMMLNSSLWRPVLAVLGGAAAVWVCILVLRNHSVPTALQWGLGSALYVGWLVLWMDTLHEAPVRAASAGFTLAMGTGLAVLIGASASLGQLGLAVGSAALAYLLIMFVTNAHLSCGRVFTLPLALIAGLVGCLAVFTAALPWYALPALAAIPFVARMPVSEKMGVWLQSILLVLVTLVFAGIAVYLSWRINGLPPL
ncbi:MAG TPA: hypothetical protein VFR06_04145 [Gallionellaceae bacterium]|nr:hypothetical protein [Gallionellaceae bacterium]